MTSGTVEEHQVACLRRRWHSAAALIPVTALAALVTLEFLWNGKVLLRNEEITGTTEAYDKDLDDSLSLVIADPPVLFNLHGFKYLIEPKPCTSEPRLGIVLVTSEYSHVEHRHAFRKGYTPKILEGIGLRMVFLLAEPPGPANSSEKHNWQQGAIEDEARRFHDILQGNFREAYKNLTYKNTMGLLWAASKCSSAKFTIKMDDDVAVNLFELAKEMRGRIGKTFELSGSVFQGSKIERGPGSKWYVPYEEYPKEYYPPYLSGWMYFGPTNLLGRIAFQATKMPYFFIDDVYLLGVVREKLFGRKVTLRDLGERFTYQTSDIVCCLALRKTTCKAMIAPTSGDVGLMLRFIQRAIMCADGTKCLPPVKTNSSCSADSRAIAEQMFLSLAARNNMTSGNASPVPL